MAITANDATEVNIGNCLFRVWAAAQASSSALILGVTEEGSILTYTEEYFEVKSHEGGTITMDKRLLGFEVGIEVGFKQYFTTMISVITGGSAFSDNVLCTHNKPGTTPNKYGIGLYPQANESTALIYLHYCSFEPNWSTAFKNDEDSVFQTIIHPYPRPSDGSVLTLIGMGY